MTRPLILSPEPVEGSKDEGRIERVMRETGMARLQALRHLQQRDELARRLTLQRRIF